MGLRDILRMGKVMAGAARAVRDQRTLGRDLAALPMAEFVPECLQHLNQSGGAWAGRLRPPHPEAAAIAARKKLPDELAEFYLHCDGFEALEGEFPAALLPIDSLSLGLDCRPALSSQLQSFWQEHDNPSEREGYLSILPPDNLAALVAHAADCWLKPATVDLAVPLCPPRDRNFRVVLLADAGPLLPRGCVVEVEGGAGTRWPSFKAWLGSQASMFGSMAAMAPR